MNLQTFKELCTKELGEDSQKAWDELYAKGIVKTIKVKLLDSVSEVAPFHSLSKSFDLLVKGGELETAKKVGLRCVEIYEEEIFTAIINTFIGSSSSYYGLAFPVGKGHSISVTIVEIVALITVYTGVSGLLWGGKIAFMDAKANLIPLSQMSLPSGEPDCKLVVDLYELGGFAIAISNGYYHKLELTK